MTVQFPAMRSEVVVALEALADRAYQERAWIRLEQPAGTEDDLTLNIHILFDDTSVLPDPTERIGSVLIDGDEVGALADLGAVLSPLIDRLGDAPDDAYLGSDEWPQVVRLAGAALAAMRRANGDAPAARSLADA